MMKIEEIQEQWSKDAVIDKTATDDESLKIPKLHSKYYNIYCTERLRWRQQDSNLKKLKAEKFEFYTQGPSKEQIAAGIELPSRGKILRADVSIYMDADKDIIDLSLKMAYTQEKVELLESIIKCIMQRNFQLRVSLDFMKFTNGG